MPPKRKKLKVSINADRLESSISPSEIQEYLELKLKDSDDLKTFVQDLRERAKEPPKVRQPLVVFILLMLAPS